MPRSRIDRRTFLELSAAGAVALALPACKKSEQPGGGGGGGG